MRSKSDQLSVGFMAQIGSCGLSINERETLEAIGFAYADESCKPNGSISFKQAVKLRDMVRAGEWRRVCDYLELRSQVADSAVVGKVAQTAVHAL
jgi:hypothetical protein